MNLKHVFSLSLLVALPLGAAAQTNPMVPVVPVVPQRGRALGAPRTRTSAATNSTMPAFPTLPPITPPAFPTEAAPQTGSVAAQNSGPATAVPAVVPAAAPAVPAVEPADIRYTWTMPIEEVLDDIYAPLVGRTPLRANTGPVAVNKDTMITLKTQYLTKAEAIMALETIMGMNGITVVPIGDKFFKVVTDATAAQQGGILSTNTSGGLPEAGKFITEVRQLKYADPDQVVKVLGLFSRNPTGVIYVPSTGSLILRDYTENVKRMLEMVEKLDVESSLTVKSEVIPIKYALAADISAALAQLGAQGGTSVGRQGPATGFSSGGGIGTGGGSTTPGSPYGAPGQTGISAGAGGQRSNFANNLRGIVNGAGGGGGGAGGFNLFGQVKIIADERTNSLLVFADEEDMKKIRKIIDQLDVVLAQVLIEAIILEVNLSDGKNFGVSFSQSPSTRGQFTGAGGNNVLSSGASSFLSGSSSGTNGSGGNSSVGSSFLPSLPGGFSYFGKYGNDFNAVLEAVANDSRISVLSRPQIQTSHAVEAELFIGNTVPYVTGTQNYGYSSGPSSTYSQLEVGIRLKVLPLINSDGMVSMDIDSEVEQLGTPVAIPGAGNVPTTTKRDVGAKVEVMSGDTIILGGFIGANRSLANAGIPWLMDIPLLGNLFKSSAAANSRTELIVLMRPTVLKNPRIAAAVAAAQREKMAGVKQAELEIRRDEDDRNAKATKQLQKDEEKRIEKAQKAGQPTNAVPEFERIESNAPVNLHLTETNSATIIEKEKQ